MCGKNLLTQSFHWRTRVCIVKPIIVFIIVVNFIIFILMITRNCYKNAIILNL